jgi:hypothetical protein
VRHKSDRYPVKELLSKGLLEAYQAYQSKPVFHKADRIVSFYGLDGTRACFFGVFTKVRCQSPEDVSRQTTSTWEAIWREENKFFYQLERLRGFEHLEGRVIIEWGPVARSWCQRLVNKPVLEITSPGRVLQPFSDYLEFSLTYDQLQALYRNEDAHREWRSRLSAVAGVYLILAETTGKLYVGSAAGAEGIWGRWREYAKTKHGDNELLKDLIEADPDYPKAFRFSILQIVPKSMTRQDVVAREGHFKEKLGRLACGLNLN